MAMLYSYNSSCNTAVALIHQEHRLGLGLGSTVQLVLGLWIGLRLVADKSISNAGLLGPLFYNLPKVSFYKLETVIIIN